MAKRLPFLTLLLAIALLMGGCWNRRDPEKLSLVQVTAFDYDPQEDMYTVIVHTVNTQVVGAEQGQKSQEPAVLVTMSQGLTPFQAVRNLAPITHRELFWAHNRLLLISEQAARAGIEGILDLFERDRQLRVTARALVVSGDIRKLMGAEIPGEQTTSEGIANQVDAVQRERSSFMADFVSELSALYARPGQDLAIGRLEFLSDSGSKTTPLKTAGMAFFRGGQMVGWADEEETAGWQILTNQASRATLIAPDPSSQERVTIEVISTRTSLQPVIENGKLRVKATIDGRGRISDYQGNAADLDGYNEFTRSLQRRIATVIRRRVEAYLSRAAELKTDPAGLGNLLYRKMPDVWAEISPQWPSYLAHLPVDLEIKITLLRPGLITRPLKSTGGNE